MVAQQRIDRVRREYNQWAANQTLEDFALRFTAKKARKFSTTQVGQTALGAISFLALEAISGSITVHYGFSNTIAAIVVVSLIIFCAGLPICFYAAKYGVDIDLLTRGAGFGYIGSTITSLIYASFTFILFAIESSIMAIALQLCLGIPPWIGYVISALAVIPLVTYGISAISRFQVWTQPIWIALNVVPVIAIVWKTPAAVDDWRWFAGSQNGSSAFQLSFFGAAASVTLALIVQIGEQVDYLRFLPHRRQNGLAWWLALLSAGPGWVVVAIPKLLAGSFLAAYLVRQGTPSGDIDPPHMYASAFMFVVGSPRMSLLLTCVFVVVCQLKINVTNAYAGSIAWSNFFSRLTHAHPGRVVWLVFNVTIALLVMEVGIYGALEKTLAFYSNIAVAWLGAIVADLVINKPLGLSPPHIEFKRAYLYDVNPVGVGAMVIAATLSITAQFGYLGRIAEALAPFLSLGTALVCAPAIAWLTRGRYYLARPPYLLPQAAAEIVCCICENAFEPEDMAHCPVYSGPICSLCCSLDARCGDACKPGARLQEQLNASVAALMPRRLRARVGPLGLEFMSVLILANLFIVVVLGLIGITLSADRSISHATLIATLWKTFAILAIAVVIVSWLVALLQVSRRAAHDEMLRQSQLLLDEIEAHKKTDHALKKAKEAAESANFAKSRYVVGLSHELRTPLNSIMGYAQLLDRDDSMTTKSRKRISVMRRSANHLAGLIDGLLDISKIEAGRLDLARDQIDIHAFLTQLIDMFSIQAEAKGIRFVAEVGTELPPRVAADERRLRQVLINLLSNAIKFTPRGTVHLSVKYRNEVAIFQVEDTGPGIAAADLERIFHPFERLKASAAEAGTGLGLTICRLLAGVMGGEIRVESVLGRGSIFRFRLFLPRVEGRRHSVRAARTVDGAFGRGRMILVVDDDPTHRTMMAEALSPYGFEVLEAEDGEQALEKCTLVQPDVFLIDIEMPGITGWELARSLRAVGHLGARIVMVSASALGEPKLGSSAPFHDAFVTKPVDVDLLVETLADLLAPSLPLPLAPAAVALGAQAGAELGSPGDDIVRAMIQYAEVGYLRGLREQLALTRSEGSEAFVEHMTALVDKLDMAALIRALERVREASR